MSPALAALQQRVIAAERCTLCGGCLGLCPYLTFCEGRVVRLRECLVEDGRCLRYCPRVKLDPVALLQGRSGVGLDLARVLGLGPCALAIRARARDAELRSVGQSGGVVSALVTTALEKGLIQAALLSHRPDGVGARGKAARTRQEVLACAGSGYAAGPTLAALSGSGPGPLGVVALPCQAQALARMRAAPASPGSPPLAEVRLVIGLFCTLAFDERRLGDYLAARLGRLAGLRFDITPPPERLLRVLGQGGARFFPLDELEPCVRACCRTCYDMTAELADVSVGTVEGLPGWSTVLVRSATGRELLERARAALEVEDLADDYLPKLALASRGKKRRALERGAADDYLELAPQLRELILRQE